MTSRGSLGIIKRTFVFSFAIAFTFAFFILLLENEPNLSLLNWKSDKLLNCPAPWQDFQENKSTTDPCLIQYIRDNFIIPPPKVPTKLTTTAKTPEFLQPVQDILKTIFPKGRGFYIDCGAHDGDYNSNTKFIERDFQWTGLLIEPDVRVFSKLKSRGRNGYLAQLCLSTSETTQKMKFYKNVNHADLNALWDRKDFGETKLEIINCIPLYSLLNAINISNVDFFSLDIEGKELEVLKTIPFDKIRIKVLQVEHWFIPEGLEGLKTFMASKGYTYIRNILGHGTKDSVYVQNDLVPLITSFMPSN